MKTFVVDTNVLLFDPFAIKSFKGNEVVVPITVLDELDAAKVRPDAIGRNARAVVRFLDGLRSEGSLSQGVKHEDVIVRVELNHSGNIPSGMEVDKKDNRIISVALGLQKERDRVVLISKDINMRVKCDVLGIPAEDYYADKVTDTPNSVYTGVQHIDVTSEFIDMLFAGGEMPNEFGGFPNQFIVLKAIDKNQVALAKVVGNKLKVVKPPDNIRGIKPRNVEQRMAMDLLMNPKIKLVTMIGRAGSGKTLLAVAAGLHYVLSKGSTYNRMLVSRPIQPMGKDIGFLPGPQPLDARILTPTGWKLMGELKENDLVITRKGMGTSVEKIYKKGIKDVYEITTTDGKKTQCCLDHLWYTQTAEDFKRKRQGSVKSTNEILNTLKNKNGKLNHIIPINEIVNFQSKDLPIPPYTMGVLLGEGYFGGAINISNTDQELINRVELELKQKNNCVLYNDNKSIIYNIKKLHNEYGKTAQRILITNTITNESVIYSRIGEALEFVDINRSTLHHRCEHKSVINNIKYEFLPSLTRWTNPIKNELHNYGLLNKKAWEKFIPNDYLYAASVEDRIALLQGLMDSEGTIKEITGEASFCTTSFKLANDIIHLVRSLGGRATLCSRDRIGKTTIRPSSGRNITTRRVSYEFTISFDNYINPFYISRKAIFHTPRKYLHGCWIESIRYVGKKEVQCILIDDPEHLYITDDFIVTHNTVEEKLDPWMQPLYDNLDLLLGSDRHMLEMYKDQGIIQVEPLTYIRGRSIPNSLMIVDEAQNLMLEEIKTIITRVGEDTKIILTGDIEQIDHHLVDFADNGLTQTVERFKHYDIAGHITLQKCERSELAELGAKIL